MGSIVTVMSLQLLVYPYLAKVTSAETYGVILTLMGIVNIIIVGLGNSLNNIRLIQNNEYINKNVHGDFNALLIGSLIVGSLIILIFSQLFPSIAPLTRYLLIATLFAGICRSYFSASFRLNLNFTQNMICSFVIASGYLIGLFLVRYTEYWPLAFLIGETAGCVFIYFTTQVMKEPLTVTVLFRQTFKKYITLLVSVLLANVIVYLDRLILYPTLGGDAVATFTVASFFGKSLGLVINPIAGVLLGYYAQKDFLMTRLLFWRINLAVGLFSLLFCLFAYFSATWFTGLLYPTLIGKATPYIMLANLAAIISAAGNMTQPAVLRFSPIRAQIVIQFIYGTIYLAGGLILLKYFFITGFCIAAIVAGLMRLLALYWIGNNTIQGI